LVRWVGSVGWVDRLVLPGCEVRWGHGGTWAKESSGAWRACRLGGEGGVVFHAGYEVRWAMRLFGTGDSVVHAR
jgi:hypothetical protein